MPHLPKALRRDPGLVARLAIGLLTVLMLLLMLGAWGFLRSTWRTQQTLARDSAEIMATVIAGTLSPDSLFLVDVSFDPETQSTNFETVAAYTGLPSSVALQESLAEVSRSHPTLDLAILSLDGKVIVDKAGIRTSATPDQWADADAAVLKQAVTGDVSASPLDAVSHSLRAYAVLRDDTRTPIGVLRVEASSPAAYRFRMLLRRLSVATLLVAVVIIVIWWLLLRLIRRARQAERSADQADRLRALGTATAGIAHEIRNPLGIMLLSVEELRAAFKSVADPKVRAGLDGLAAALYDEVRRLSQLTNQFLDFARPDEDMDETLPLDFSSSAASSVRLFQKGAPRSLHVSFRGLEESVPVLFGENRLRQVLLNLLRNSSEAIGQQDGRIDVTVERVKDRVILTVRDNGPGMDSSTLERVFDPFFTTRAEGSGLGLPLSRSLVEAAGGKLTLESEKRKGTTARIEFPVATAAALLGPAGKKG